MIRCKVRSQWLHISAGFLNVNPHVLSPYTALSAQYAVPLTCCVHTRNGWRLNWAALWTASNLSPPTRGSDSRQGQMKSFKRSLTDLSSASGTCLRPSIRLLPLHSVNNQQAANFVSDAWPDSDTSVNKRTLRIRKTKVGQLLAANPMTRGRPREDKLKGRSTTHPRYHKEKNEHDEIDIHSPEGALQNSLPTEDELDKMFARERKDAATESNHQSIDHDDLKELNVFDEQYFLDVAKNKNPLLQKTRPVKPNTPKQTDFDGRNEFDQQYFGSVQDRSLSSKDARESRKMNMDQSRKNNAKPVYIDTSSPEDHFDNLAYEAEAEEAIKDFDKQLGKLFESNAGEAENINIRSLFEPHETATTFKRLEDDEDLHKEVTFEMEKKFEEMPEEKISSNRTLKAKLEAERKFLETKDEFRIGDHNLSDLEPEIIKALKMAWQAKRVVRTKTQKNKIFGTPDSTLPSTNIPCSGCGAIFQAHNLKQPGFLPSEKYRELLDNNGLERAACQRCWLLTHRQMALDVSIGENDYKDIISSIRKKKALVVVLVDLLDFPCSFIPNLQKLVGEGKPMVIVGNKADLLPKDSEDCYRRIKTHLLQACIDAKVCNGDNVKHVCIVSAKSGFGIEDLITALQNKWGTTGDIYLLGTANVGKSTLFNRLLESDYCKAKASLLISKATISRWPGTTLNLLRFPVVRRTAEKAALRQDRLQAERKQEKVEKELRKTQRKKDDTLRLDEEAYVRGPVGRSYDIDIKEEEKELDSDDPFSITLGKLPTPTHLPKAKNAGKEKLPFPFKQKEFDLGHWFYDTPGMIQDQQILTKLTSDELKAVVPKKVILPQSIVIKPGNTIFIGGMGRLDYLEGHKAAFFTLFTPKTLPIRVVSTMVADEHYQNMVDNDQLKVPLGGKERLKTLPALKAMEMTVHGVGWDCSAADVLFSSVGWAAITAAKGMEVELRAYTPGGCGCLLRCPALLPYVVNLRGKRLANKSPFFRVDKQKLMRYL